MLEVTSAVEGSDSYVCLGPLGEGPKWQVDRCNVQRLVNLSDMNDSPSTAQLGTTGLHTRHAPSHNLKPLSHQRQTQKEFLHSSAGCWVPQSEGEEFQPQTLRHLSLGLVLRNSRASDRRLRGRGA